ncbi:MAG: Npt1/Npt2 family nucleotide transporter [Chlamydiota bacterium]
MSSAYQALIKEIRSYSYFEKMFIFFVMLCSFCITAEYSITKPVSCSVFIYHFSTAFFPYAWLIIFPFNFLVVTLYNRLLPRLGCHKMMLGSVAMIIIANSFSSFFLKSSPVFSFIHFVWKDIYVMLMFQSVWSVVHSTIAAGRAKYLYGIIYGIGGLGSVLGSSVTALLAVKVGSERLLLSTVIFYTFLMVFYHYILHFRDKLDHPESIVWKNKDTAGGFKLIASSRLLQFILLLVVFMQVASTLIDFQFSTYLQDLFPNKDIRTAYTGRLFSVVHMLNIFLQFFGAWIVMHFLGLKKSHLSVPLLFLLSTLAFIFTPSFQVISTCFCMVKAFDYSIFTIIKEMLYLPLKMEAKFKAKAIIDVFAYRSSRALASFVVIALQMLHLNQIQCMSWILCGLFLLWFGTTFFMFSKQHALATDSI